MRYINLHFTYLLDPVSKDEQNEQQSLIEDAG